MESMTLEDYMVPVKPKIQGTYNLHNAFASENLDFFIMLSSVSGILGRRGQANYAAGHTFQDAFARRYNAQENNKVSFLSLDYLFHDEV